MNKKLWIGVGGVLLVGLLAAGAFFGIRLLRGGLTGANALNGPISLGGGGPGGGSISVMIRLTPAPGLPAQRADLSGQVVDIKDNSLFVQTQNGPVMIQAHSSSSDESGSGSSVSSSPTQDPSAPTTEVVVNEDTKIYQDTTMDAQQPPQSSGEYAMQQEVEEISVGQIAKDQHVQVWGQKRGDRLIAEVIVVMGMRVVSGGPAGK